MLLSSAYFPPVQYFSKLSEHKDITLEACENYQRRSYRNRCLIGAANGIIALSVPVLKGKSENQAIRDVRISYETNWQRVHLRSIMSSYRHSPYYEFVIDELIFTWVNHEKYLFDLNFKILEVIIELSGLSNIQISLSKKYTEIVDNEPDWRKIIHPRVDIRDDKQFQVIPYQQAFSDRHGFQPNLSILDTLFQIGPEIPDYLDNCITI